MRGSRALHALSTAVEGKSITSELKVRPFEIARDEQGGKKIEIFCPGFAPETNLPSARMRKQ